MYSPLQILPLAAALDPLGYIFHLEELAISQVEPDSTPHVRGLLRGQRHLQWHRSGGFFQRFAGSDGHLPRPWRLRNIWFN
jgi:hypothetical protein